VSGRGGGFSSVTWLGCFPARWVFVVYYWTIILDKVS
jgi:hypothetical protein